MKEVGSNLVQNSPCSISRYDMFFMYNLLMMMAKITITTKEMLATVEITISKIFLPLPTANVFEKNSTLLGIQYKHEYNI